MSWMHTRFKPFFAPLARRCGSATGRRQPLRAAGASARRAPPRRVRPRHLTDKPLITSADYSPPADNRRLAVAAVRVGKIHFCAYLAQTKGSGLK
jgi:hypothetical protein